MAFHAVRNLLRIGRGMAELRWMQLGFGSNTATTTDEATPRNLMGFKDGTRNLRVDDDASMDRFVWVGAEEPQAWFRGGTYVVARRIRMLIEAWDRDSLGDQEAVIGRRKASGAPLSGTKEFDPPDLARPGDPGERPHPPRRAVHERRRAGSCVAATRTRTGSTPAPGCSTPACSSSASSATPRPASSRSSAGSARPTPSASTSSTPAAACSRCCRACAAGSTSARACCG